MTQLPQSVVFELTYACNHACPFCSCPWEAEGTERGMELSIEDWKKAALEFIGHGVRNIILSGGEPLLKEGIGDLLGFLAFQLRAAYGIHYDLQLSTNGTLLTREMLHLLKDCNATLCTSLPSIFDFKGQTGTGQDFRAVLKHVYAASELGIRSTVGIPLTKAVLPELYEMISYALLSGTDTVLLNPFRPSGRGASHPEYLLSPEDIHSALNTAEEVFHACKGKVRIGGEYPPGIVDPAQYPDLILSTDCPAAKGIFTVSPDGMIRLCEHDPRLICRWDEWKALEQIPVWREMTTGKHPVCPLFS